MKEFRFPLAVQYCWPYVAMAAAAITTLTGCTSSQNVPATAKPKISMPLTNSPSAPSDTSGDYTFRLPIAKYSYTDSQSAVINAAENILTESCMRRYGINYRTTPAPQKNRDSDRRYGLSSADDAARYGYHLPPNLSYNPSHGLNADAESVLYGISGDAASSSSPMYNGEKIPVNGCRGEAIRTLGAGHDYKEGAEAASGIANRSYQESIKDPQVQGVTRRWSSCMKTHGYTYPSPLAALGDRKFLANKIAQGEIETAETDIRCKAKVNLLSTWFSVETRIQKKMITKQSRILEKLNEAHVLKVAAAQKVISRN
ncbi:hypothetical protein [Streptomyces mirabilis]|uniref:hypothetical protein n=1 Tax=Streptomyces mirabilis TaxID=68239 RepID=UPI00332D57DE